MYSGSTLTPLSGNLLGAHQKIDRVARRELQKMLPESGLPRTRHILHFEGHNGPDAIKRKSPAKNEPWHYFQPFDSKDTHIITLIEQHYKQLTAALKEQDEVRAAFEAAWLAHAVVDGLTPAHHYPYEERLVELRAGRGLESRTTLKEKLLFPGESLLAQLANNWKFWGPRGLFTTHYTFEWGVAMLIATMRFRSVSPSSQDLAKFQSQSLGAWFRDVAQEVARMELYDAFYKTGWTIPLARRVRQQLAPTLIRSVTLVWYGAALEAHHK